MTAFLHTKCNSSFFTIQSFDVTYSKALKASLNKQVREKATEPFLRNWKQTDVQKVVQLPYKILHNRVKQQELYDIFR